MEDECVLRGPIKVSGVIVYVNEDAGYAYLDAAQFGRVLIFDHYKKGVVEVASWFSLHIQNNHNPTLTYEVTNCRFSDASELVRSQELLPYGKATSKAGIEQVRVQSPVYLGHILPRGGVGLSPLFGRVFFPKIVVKRLELTLLRWAKCGIVSVIPGPENFFSGWEARCVEGEVAPEEKCGIRIFRARYYQLMLTNFCLLKLLPEGTGYAQVLATDFADAVDENVLAQREIEVVARIPVARANLVPVPICYALLVGSETHQAFLKRDLDLGDNLGIDKFNVKETKGEHGDFAENMAGAYVMAGDRQYTDGATYHKSIHGDKTDDFSAPEGVCSNNCESIGVIIDALKDERFSEICGRENPELMVDLRAFMKQFGF